MFNSDDLKCLDPAYFNIIAIDDYDVTIMSRNTGHYGYIHNCEWPDAGSVVVFHKHRYQHNRANTLRQAVRSIKRHDRWQMNGRKW